MDNQWYRIGARILAGVLCLSLSGCNSVNPPSTSPTIASNTFYNKDTGDFRDDITDEELSPEPEEMSKVEEVMPDNEDLWDVEGTPAFYIPDYHSARNEDIVTFQVLDVQGDGETVIYAYETLCYKVPQTIGVDAKGYYCDGLPSSGTVPEDFSHKNWDGDAGDDAPQTDQEIVCVMAYQTRSRQYRILYLATGPAPEKITSNPEQGGDNGTTDASAKQDAFSSKNLFAEKVRDEMRYLGGDYFYYAFYNGNMFLFDQKGAVRDQYALDEAITREVYSLLKANESKKGWDINITNILSDGDYQIHMTVLAEDANAKDADENMDEDEISDARKQILISMRFLDGKDVVFVSNNRSFDDQVWAWNDKEYGSEEGLYDDYPDDFGNFIERDTSGNTIVSPVVDHSSQSNNIDAINSLKVRLQTASRQYWKEAEEIDRRSDLSSSEKDAWRKAIWEDYAQARSPEPWKYGFQSWPVFLTGANVDQYKNSDRNYYYLVSYPSGSTEYSCIFYNSPVQIEDLKSDTETVTATFEHTDDQGNVSETVQTTTLTRARTFTFSAADMRMNMSESKFFTNDIVANNHVGYCSFERNDDSDPEVTSFEVTGSYYNGFSIPTLQGDLLVQMRLLNDESGQDYYFNAVGLGEKNIYVGAAKYGPEDFKWTAIPYSMAFTGEHETSISYIEYDESGQAREQTIAPKDAVLTFANNGICQEGDRYRFTTLESGILLYDPRYHISYILDPYQYYGSWKQSDGSYVAIGFQSAQTQAIPNDIMKAKIYRLTPDLEQIALGSIQHVLKENAAERAKFISDPDSIYAEYGLDVSRGGALEAYENQVKSVEQNYEQAKARFWKLLNLPAGQPTAEKKAAAEEQLDYCTSRQAIEELMKETRLDIAGSQVDPDTIAPGESEYYRSMLIAQAYADEKDAILDSIKKWAGYVAEPLENETEEERKQREANLPDWNADIDGMADAIRAEMDLWS